HAASPYATIALRLRAHRIHRIPHPTSVTTRTPLSSRQDGVGHRTDFSWRGSAKFFEKRLDRGSIEQPVGQIDRGRKRNPSLLMVTQWWITPSANPPYSLSENRAAVLMPPRFRPPVILTWACETLHRG